MSYLKPLYGLLICLLSTAAFGQKQGNRWYFGNEAGVDFTTGEATFLGQGQIPFMDGHSEGTSSICDSSGALLFYTNGETIWNKNHDIMENGSGLLGSWSSTQSSLIVPEPGSDLRFYVFTTDGFIVTELQNGFRYSIVDMCANEGLGEVKTNSKNVLLLDTVSEKLAAVKHANGTDYWIVVHKYWSDAFHAYWLSENGITDEVISNVGYVHEDNTPLSMNAAIGQMKISSDGSSLALCISNRNPTLFELFDFDIATGVVSNSIQFPTTNLGTLYGIEFSPDNTKLYLGAAQDGIFQVDLTAGNETAIVNSMQPVFVPFDSHTFGLQLGPNGKIYVANFGDSDLGVINNPNELGSNCNYVASHVSLNDNECSYTLPSFVAGFNYHNNEVDCTTSISDRKDQSNLRVYPNPVQQVGTIEFNIRPNQPVVFQLYDSLGRLVLTSNSTNSDKLVFDTSDLQNGIYFYQLKSGSEILGRGKILKENTGHNKT